MMNGKIVDWQRLLIAGKQGPRPLLANAVIALRDSPEWHGILAFDAFYQRSTLRGQPPWASSPEDRAWNASDDLRAADWLQHQHIAVSPDIASQAVELASRESTFHPVLDYLARCRWDPDRPLLDHWTSRFLGTPETPYTRAVGSRWMISAVARVNQPGCKADCALILEGRQGTLKSTAFKTLFHPWFVDELAELGSKDSSLQLAGAWGIEMAELDSLKRGDVSRIKAFLSRTTDRYRPPYGRRIVEQPRQCVFAGTVNDTDYLRDDSGARRFWPLECSGIDIDGLIANRDAIWAETRDRYLADEPWWLDTDDLTTAASYEQHARYLQDPWLEPVSEFIAHRSSITPSEFLIEIGRTTREQTQLDLNRVVACLKVLGWRKRSVRTDAGPRYRYFAPSDLLH